jgi:AcrR family transcriptional regulator
MKYVTQILEIRVAVSQSTGVVGRSSRRERELAARRADVVAAATAVFAEKGFHDAQMAAVARRAELSLATVYEFFEGKEDIYCEVIRSATADLRSMVRPRVEAAVDPGERVLVLVDALFDAFEQERDALRIVLSGSHALPWRIRENLGVSLDEVQDFVDWVIGLCQAAATAGRLEGIGAEAFAMSLLGAVTHCVHRTMAHDPEQPATRLAPEVRELFARALTD